MMTYAVKLETPAFAAPTGWDGYITQIYNATVSMGVNRAGSFSVSVPMSANQAAEVKRGWRVTILENAPGTVNSAGSAFTVPPLLYRGKVLRRTAVLDEAGGVTLVLEGETFMGRLADLNIHDDLTFTTQTLNTIVSALLTPLGISYTVPTRCLTQTLSIDFSNMSYLQMLIRLAELTRTNLVDTFNGVIRFTDKDELPDPLHNLNAADPHVYIINQERVGPDNRNAAVSGFGIVEKPPTILYDGSMLVNRLKVVGVDFDGTPLTLEDAVGGGYTVQSAAGPLGDYFYIEDTASVTAYGRTESQLVRADFHNPNDDADSRQAVKNGLLAIATGEMLKRRSEFFTAQVQLANSGIYALPGEKVHLRYKGAATYSEYGAVTTVDIDRWCLVTRRYDTVDSSGVRRTGLDLSAPELTYQNPSLPDVISIPTPDERQLPPEKLPLADEDLPLATDEWPIIENPYVDPELVDALMEQFEVGPGAYQPCCGPPGEVPLNPDDDGGVAFPTRACYMPPNAVAVQTIRFVEKWGEGWANPGLDALADLIPGQDCAIVVLSSASADPVLVVSGAGVTSLGAWESPTPANFGGDGYHYWRIYFLDIQASLIDFAGSTGAFRECTFFRFGSGLATGGGTGGSGVDVQFSADLQYHGSMFGQAIESASAGGSTIYGDVYWSYIDEGYRSIDDLEFNKDFNAIYANHDFDRINSEFVTFTPGGGAGSATDWIIDTEDDGFGSHSVTNSFRCVATASFFPGACRVLAFCAGARLRGRCQEVLFG